MAAPGIHLLRCLTPLHNGSGQGLGDIDRPIVREVTTGFPYVQGKTIKGAALARAQEQRGAQTAASMNDPTAIRDAFGAGAESGGGGNQGAVGAVDAQLLLFPVRSLAGTFVWTTSLLCLARLQIFLESIGSSLNEVIKPLLDHSVSPGEALAPSSSENDDDDWSREIRLDGAGTHVLEGLVLTSNDESARRKHVARLACELGERLFGDDKFWIPFFKKRLLLLSHADFDHLVQSATVVEANIRILETGITDDGSLRYTEFLPAETILYSYYTVAKLGLSDERLAVAVQTYEQAIRGDLQLGADESAGKGIVRVSAV